ncbi:MAG TPA: DJ-1/PfpI family protein [Candidatus Hydrogenedentes bacterium]|nr:DJ-1/PfpI family protein [Candidatus Hydrogenedentota bacterium]
MPKVLVPLADGCEEMEAVTIIDILRRANITVVTAGLSKELVKASRGTVLAPDATLDEALKLNRFDMIVLPGGLPGADNLGNDVRICDALVKCAAEGHFVAAICAAPRVLADLGLLDGKKATAYPGFLENNFPAISYTGAAVERDGKIITGRGPGTAMDFALTLVEALTGMETKEKVEKTLVRD